MVLKRYDTALADFLRLKIPEVDVFGRVVAEVDVPQTFATPRRAFMFWPETVQEQAEFAPMSTPRLIEPRSVLTRLNATFNYNRFVSADRVWRHRYSDDLNEILVSRVPLPYDIMYQYDVTTKTFHDSNLLLEQLMLKFGRPVWQITVNLPPPWGERPIQLLFEGDQDFNVYETGEEQRVLRWVGTITMEGWIPYPPEWVKTVQKISVDVIEERSNEIFAYWETEYANKKLFKETGDNEQVLEWK